MERQGTRSPRSGLNDILFGTTGNNVFEGLAGDDILVGNFGDDTFRFLSAGTGNDVITDFDADPIGGQDLIDVSGRGFTAASIGSAILISTAGADTFVTIGTDHIRLIGVATANITATDFIF
jgi:Ca2+-binding RTX toxin-like protein